MAKENTINIATEWFFATVMDPKIVTRLTRKEFAKAISNDIKTNGVSIVTLEEPYNMRRILPQSNYPGIVMIVTPESVQGKKDTEQMQYIRKNQ